MTNVDTEKAKLYQEASRAWADPSKRLSKNRTMHIQRWVSRNSNKGNSSSEKTSKD